MRVLMLSHSNGGGGAGRASDRLFRALDGAGADLRMHVDFAQGGDPRITSNDGRGASVLRRLRITVDEVPAVLAGHPTPSLFSPATMSALTAAHIDRMGADIVDIHWTNFGYLSVRQLGRIRTPLVWHMHDMWAFTGGENYASDAPAARWRTGYRDDADPPMRWDVERWVYQRKQRHWTRPRTLIASSTWMAGLARLSPLVGDWPVHVIPNPVDTDRYSPGSRSEARALLGLPPDVPLVVALLPTHLDDPRKGFDLLRAALVHLARERPDLHLAVVGHDRPPADWYSDLPIAHWLGRQDDAGCIAAYRAADVVVVPSRQDNSPQTATEALACGVPVVAFGVSGLPDFVIPGETGYLAPAEDVAGLAHGITWLLDDDTRRARLREQARKRAVAQWAPEVVARAHLDLYAAVVAQTGRPEPNP